MSVEKELMMYGMTKDQIREEYVSSITGQLAGKDMVVAGILSDIQEMLEYGFEKNDIRQLLNVAKFVLFDKEAA